MLEYFDAYVAAGDSCAEMSRDYIISALVEFRGKPLSGINHMIQPMVNEIVVLYRGDLDILRLCGATKAKILPAKETLTILARNDIAANLKIGKYDVDEVVAKNIDDEIILKYIIHNADEMICEEILTCIYRAGRLTGELFHLIALRNKFNSCSVYNEIAQDSDLFALIVVLNYYDFRYLPSVEFCRSKIGLSELAKNYDTTNMRTIDWISRMSIYPDFYLAANHMPKSLRSLLDDKTYLAKIKSASDPQQFKYAAGNFRKFTIKCDGGEYVLPEFFAAGQSALIAEHVEKFGDDVMEIDICEKYVDRYIMYMFDKKFAVFDLADVDDLIEMENAFYYFSTPFDEFDFIRASFALGGVKFGELILRSKYWLRIAAKLE